MIAAQIQALEKWKLEDEIQKMQFSRNWFARFKLFSKHLFVLLNFKISRKF